MRAFPLVAMLLASAAAAEGPVAAPVLSAPAGPAALFVELVVNGLAGGAIASVTQDGDRLLVAAADLRAAGIAVAGEDAIDVAHFAAMRTTYDMAGQRLLIDVPAALLPLRRINAPMDAPLLPSVDAGALLNYDVYVQSSGGETSASLWTEQRVFGAFGTIANTGIVTAGGTARDGYVRLDTRYQWTDEARALELNAGDLITRALPWSTAMRIGGVQLSRSFALRPDLVTVPLPSFSGEAAVPTGVDLFINGYRQTRADVAPGRFVLDSVPVVNGAGEARIVTTDAVGRQIATVIPFYVAPDLLRRGLTDFSVEAGALRRNYGLASFDYGRAVASASVRHGLAQTLTLSGHAEVTGGMAGVGMGAAWAPGLWGSVSGSVMVSSAPGATATQVTAGYSYAGRRFSIGAEHVERSDGYTDLGGYDIGQFAGSVRSDRVTLSVPIEGVGAVGAGYIASRLRSGDTIQLASASFSRPLGQRASAFGAADYDFARGTLSAQLRVVLPFGRSAVASAGVAREPDGAARFQASVTRAVPTAGGFGYAGDVAYTTRGQAIGQASATWRGASVQLEAGAASAGGAQTLWGGASGSVALLDGRLFAANALPGAFALVATGMPGVPVYYENQRIGETGAGGHLFVPNVAARHASRFAIDPLGLPIGADAAATEARTALRAGTGAVVRLPVRVRRSVTARLVDAAGVPIAAGSIATPAGGRGVPVGWDGVVLVEDAAGPVALTVRTAAGACRATLPDASAAGALADLGVVPCR